MAEINIKQITKFSNFEENIDKIEGGETGALINYVSVENKGEDLTSYHLTQTQSALALKINELIDEYGHNFEGFNAELAKIHIKTNPFLGFLFNDPVSTASNPLHDYDWYVNVPSSSFKMWVGGTWQVIGANKTLQIFDSIKAFEDGTRENELALFKVKVDPLDPASKDELFVAVKHKKDDGTFEVIQYATKEYIDRQIKGTGTSLEDVINEAQVNLEGLQKEIEFMNDGGKTELGKPGFTLKEKQDLLPKSPGGSNTNDYIYVNKSGVIQIEELEDVLKRHNVEAKVPWLTDHYANVAEFGNTAPDNTIVSYDTNADGTPNSQGILFLAKVNGGLKSFITWQEAKAYIDSKLNDKLDTSTFNTTIAAINTTLQDVPNMTVFNTELGKKVDKIDLANQLALKGDRDTVDQNTKDIAQLASEIQVIENTWKGTQALGGNDITRPTFNLNTIAGDKGAFTFATGDKLTVRFEIDNTAFGEEKIIRVGDRADFHIVGKRLDGGQTNDVTFTAMILTDGTLRVSDFHSTGDANWNVTHLRMKLVEQNPKVTAVIDAYTKSESDAKYTTKTELNNKTTELKAYIHSNVLKYIAKGAEYVAASEPNGVGSINIEAPELETFEENQMAELEVDPKAIKPTDNSQLYVFTNVNKGTFLKLAFKNGDVASWDEVKDKIYDHNMLVEKVGQYLFIRSWMLKSKASVSSAPTWKTIAFTPQTNPFPSYRLNVKLTEYIDKKIKLKIKIGPQDWAILYLYGNIYKKDDNNLYLFVKTKGEFSDQKTYVGSENLSDILIDVSGGTDILIRGSVYAWKHSSTSSTSLIFKTEDNTSILELIGVEIYA